MVQHTGRSFDSRNYAGSAPEAYERYFVPAIGAPLAADLLEVARLRDGERVLDVACGTGVVARLAAGRLGAGGTVAGLDVNPGMLEVARASAPPEASIDWYETGAEATPLPDASFDVILCQMGLQFFADKAGALAEMYRALAPGGRAVITLPGPTPEMFRALADGLSETIHADAAKFAHAVFSLHDGDKLSEMMTGAGFGEVGVAAERKTLALPGPADFLWQYVHSTPLAGVVAKASEEQKEALQRRVTQRWRAFERDGGMELELTMNTVTAMKAA